MGLSSDTRLRGGDPHLWSLALPILEPPSLTLTLAVTRQPQCGLWGSCPTREPQAGSHQHPFIRLLPIPPCPQTFRAAALKFPRWPGGNQNLFCLPSTDSGRRGVSVPQALWTALPTLGLGPVNIRLFAGESPPTKGPLQGLSRRPSFASVPDIGRLRAAMRRSLSRRHGPFPKRWSQKPQVHIPSMPLLGDAVHTLHLSFLLCKMGHDPTASADCS